MKQPPDITEYGFMDNIKRLKVSIKINCVNGRVINVVLFYEK